MTKQQQEEAAKGLTAHQRCGREQYDCHIASAPCDVTCVQDLTQTIIRIERPEIDTA